MTTPQTDVVELAAAFDSFDALNKMFVDEQRFVQFEKADHAFKLLKDVMISSSHAFNHKSNLYSSILFKVEHLLNEATESLYEYLHQKDYSLLLLMLSSPLIVDEYPQKSQVIKQLCHVTASLSANDDFVDYLIILFKKMDGIYATDLMQRVVGSLHMFLAVRAGPISESAHLYDDLVILDVLETMKSLYLVNNRLMLIPFSSFYSHVLVGLLDVKEDYPRYKTDEKWCLCNYSFVLTTATKSDILKVESLSGMRHELQDAFFRAMFIGINSPYLILEVRRSNIIRDTLFQLQSKKDYDLKKQLRVAFVGEEGIDEGGVQKEFYQLIVKEIFNESYGMFVENTDSRLVWFSHDPTVDQRTLEEYELIGKLLGIAVYNGVTLDIQFPTVLFKKLMDSKYRVTLEDLKEYDPFLGRSLEQLLTTDGMEDSLEYTFQIQYTTRTGDFVDVDLIPKLPDNSSIKVTKENKADFVTRYCEFILNDSCAEQFTAFNKGFNMVLKDSCINLFRAEEVMELICGSPTINFDEIEKVTKYDGYTKESPMIQWFWEIFKEFDEEMKKNFLVFTTGTDRVPVGGISQLHFLIARNGPDSDRLPTSHTCYNVLLLNEYETKEKLKDRLSVALRNSNCGFFLK